MSIDPEYMDIESALKRVGGNETLYKKLLKLFLDENHIDDLCNAIDSGNNEEAGHMAHTIKGVSANLSLTKLRAVTMDIEQRAKGGEDCKEFMPELRTISDKTIEIITEYVG